MDLRCACAGFHSSSFMKEKHSLPEILLKKEAQDVPGRPAVLWGRACFLGGSVRHIRSVFLHAVMQKMRVVAAESGLQPLH